MDRPHADISVTIDGIANAMPSNYNSKIITIIIIIITSSHYMPKTTYKNTM